MGDGIVVLLVVWDSGILGFINWGLWFVLRELWVFVEVGDDDGWVEGGWEGLKEED